MYMPATNLYRSVDLAKGGGAALHRPPTRHRLTDVLSEVVWPRRGPQRGPDCTSAARGLVRDSERHECWPAAHLGPLMRLLRCVTGSSPLVQVMADEQRLWELRRRAWAVLCRACRMTALCEQR